MIPVTFKKRGVQMKKKLLIVITLGLLIVILAACGSESEETSAQGEDTNIDLNRVRVLIGSTATGGDSYHIAETFSRYAEDVLNTNMQVDAIGALRAFDELGKASEDGSTIMLFHDMAYLGVEYGSFNEDDKLENWTIGPIVATNPGDAFLTDADAPYDTLAESAEWLADNPEETITVAIESGGTSELLFGGYYLWVEEEFGTEVSERIYVYITGSQQDKDQALWNDMVDIIHGSIGANMQYTEDDVDDQIKMKFLGISAEERVEGFDTPTFGEQGITVNGDEFIFNKEFFVLLPKDIDKNFATSLDHAAAEVVGIPDYAEDLSTQEYIVNHKPAAEAEEYLIEKRDSLQYIIENSPNLDDIAR
jgi:tripartite-type tricarboxylate transporter receptor subunit TctC